MSEHWVNFTETMLRRFAHHCTAGEPVASGGMAALVLAATAELTEVERAHVAVRMGRPDSARVRTCPVCDGMGTRVTVDAWRGCSNCNSSGQIHIAREDCSACGGAAFESVSPLVPCLRCLGYGSVPTRAYATR